MPRSALACPECGADHHSGWREDAAVYDALDLPSEEFEDEELLDKEFGARRTPSRRQIIWWIAAVIALLALVLVSLSSRW